LQAGEAGVGQAARADAQVLLSLEFALRESEALVTLTQTQLERAQQQLLGAQRLLDSFPGLLGHMRPSLLMLSGGRLVVLLVCVRSPTSRQDN
jgi:hypothetical protein